MKRCAWSGNDALMIDYHDSEWGVPVHDDRKHFEFIVLDGFQAGLSWAIVLRKREHFRKALHNFDPERIARYGARDMTRLLNDPGIIRNRQKVASVVTNARAFLETQEALGSFDAYVWRFVNGKTLTHRFRRTSEIPARTKESDAMSRDLQQRGFKFVGSTICYAYMQAAGLVNDHTVDCFRYRKV
jgi:DNA-3-methyladenine glycosylase I